MTRLLAVLALIWAMPLAAQLDAPAEPVETPTPVQTIAATQEAGADEQIAERIAGIFAELPAFTGVEVEVSEGVVALSGTVPKAEDIDRAEAIVNRISGVVTIENGLERDLSVSADSAGISVLGERWNAFVSAAMKSWSPMVASLDDSAGGPRSLAADSSPCLATAHDWRASAASGPTPSTAARASASASAMASAVA